MEHDTVYFLRRMKGCENVPEIIPGNGPLMRFLMWNAGIAEIGLSSSRMKSAGTVPGVRKPYITTGRITGAGSGVHRHHPI